MGGTIPLSLLVGRYVRQQRDRARTLDSVGELALMARATAGDAARNDLPALGDETTQTPDVLVVDEVDLVRAELADLAPPEAPALDGFLGRWNGSILL